MKKMIMIAIGVIAVFIILGPAKDTVIKVSVENGVQHVTGLKLQMGGFRAGILNTLVDIKKLRLFNPKGFKDPVMIDMPEVFVKYDLPSIMRGRVHLPEVRISLKEFIVVKNEKGELNLDSLNVVKDQKSGGKKSGKAAGKAPKIRIDSLRLKIGKVMYKDYSQGTEPRITEYKVDLDEQYKDIDDPYTLVSLVVVKSLANTSIANLAGFDLKGLNGTVTGTLSGAAKAAGQSMRTAAQTAKKTEEVVTKTAETVTGIFKNVFGSEK